MIKQVINQELEHSINNPDIKSQLKEGFNKLLEREAGPL